MTALSWLRAKVAPKVQQKELPHMSILSQLFEGKISLGTALEEIGTWFVSEVNGNTAAKAAINTAASNAAGLAGTAFGNALTEGVGAVEGWTNALITKVVGQNATQLTPSVDLALTTLEQQAQAAVSAEIAAFRAKLAPVPATPASQAAAAAPAKAP